MPLAVKSLARFARLPRGVSLPGMTAVVTLAVHLAAPAQAAWTSGFVDGGSFDGKGAGQTIGQFTDSATAVIGTLTTTALTAGTVLNEQTNLLGSGTDAVGGDAFDLNEIWTISWDKPSQLMLLDLSGYGVDKNFSVKSTAWENASITPGNAAVHFDSPTGTFTFDSNVPGDTFTTSSLYGTSTIPVIPANTGITFFTGSATGGGASIGQLSFNLQAPEPSSAALLIGAGLLVLRARRRTSHG